MATQTEVSMDDSDLDAIMAELEAETGGIVVPSDPKPVAAAPTPEPEPAPAPAAEKDEMAELEAELAAVDAEAAAASEVMALTASKAAAEVVKAAATAPAPAPKSTPAPTPDPKPDPEPEPEPAPEPERAPPKKVGGLKFNLDVRQFMIDIALSENNLDEALMQQASTFAYHAAELARAEAQHSHVKLRAEQIEAMIFASHRKAFLAAGDKPTEKMVENAVRCDPEYIAAKRLLIEADMYVGFNKSAVESLRHRKDMIVQLGADRREEFKGQTRIMSADANHASVKDRALEAGRQATA